MNSIFSVSYINTNFENMKLSIIIPVFQVGNTLASCVQSVLDQTFRDYEIILVDDGSTDNSPAICDHFAKEDRRVRVVHQSNKGQSTARNAGLQKAHGEYVTFIDSDDYIAPDTLHQLMTVLKVHPDYDILEYPIFVYFDHPVKRHLVKFAPKVYEDVWKYWLETKAYSHAYACNKVYRKSLFDHVTFPPNRLFEEVFTLPRLLRQCRIVVTTDIGLYYYHWNANGTTATADGNTLNDLLEANMLVLAHVHDADYYAHVLNIQLDVFALTGRDPVLPLLPYRKTYKQKLLHIFGMKNLCKMNKFARKLCRRH